jgi:hypothetical protein
MLGQGSRTQFGAGFYSDRSIKKGIKPGLGVEGEQIQW